MGKQKIKKYRYDRAAVEIDNVPEPLGKDFVNRRGCACNWKICTYRARMYKHNHLE